MRVCTLLAAFAVVFISQAEATIDNRVNWVKTTISETQESLEEYRVVQLNHTKRTFLNDYTNANENALSVAQYNVQLLSEDFKAAKNAGKDVNKCLQPLNSDAKAAVQNHASKIAESFDKYLPNLTAVEHEVSELKQKGEELAQNLANILEVCEEKRVKWACVAVRLPPVKISVIAWRARGERVQRAQQRASSSAEKKIAKSINSSLVQLKRKLSALNTNAKRCIAALPIPPPTTVAPVPAEEVTVPRTTKQPITEVPKVTEKVTEKSAVPEQPTTAKQPASTEVPKVTEKVTEKSVVPEQPTTAKQPASTEVPKVTEKVTEKSVVPEQPTAAKQPASTEVPKVTEKVTEKSVVPEQPTTAKQPTSTEVPKVTTKVTEKSVAPEQPTTAKQPAVTEEAKVPEKPAASEQSPTAK